MKSYFDIQEHCNGRFSVSVSVLQQWKKGEYLVAAQTGKNPTCSSRICSSLWRTTDADSSVIVTNSSWALLEDWGNDQLRLIKKNSFFLVSHFKEYTSQFFTISYPGSLNKAGGKLFGPGALWRFRSVGSVQVSSSLGGPKYTDLITSGTAEKWRLA